ncbi:hypothetical protein [Ovoidimarina sediminis]|uniref:hypothetical protein n=1 Tax=Ovoidimarina sediminis TaxID=3079856 RepID=UPI00291430AE|nr:hypothetical protein [Rhodophyticola sp. MJ-SS7]MDU8944606.1 hypothetical protein [Rhodophyticola sp. MJ-SS7]
MKDVANISQSGSTAAGLALMALVAATPATAQPAPTALDTFQSVCARNLSQNAAATALAAAGWKTASPDLRNLFETDLINAARAQNFFMEIGGGAILASTATERRGLMRKRQKSLCFVRLFAEAPDRMRADFRARMGSAPHDSTQNEAVRADIWAAASHVTGFRAVRLPEGHWMITVSRTHADG